MDAFQQLQADFQAGRVSPAQIFSFLCDALLQLQQSQQLLQETQQQLKTAQIRIEELEKKIGGKPTHKLDQPYSLRSEEKRQQSKDANKKKKKAKPGRRRNQDKMDLVARTEQVYPEGVPPERCKLSHIRQVWQIEQGQAVLVAYEVYRGPNKQYGKVPAVLGRGGYSWPIIMAVAYLVYTKGLSLDLACDILGFFKNLPIKKSQAEALMRQLAKHWERQFETLCVLLANAAVVHADETSWSIKSVWAFLSEQSRVLLFGVNKDADTLEKILDSKLFKGILISDDAGVYADFSQMQKCWAHLIRKAIKLTLQSDDPRYRRLADGLIDIYRAARAIQTDESLDDTGRLAGAAQLKEQLSQLCYGEILPQTSKGLEHDYVLLCHEVMRLHDDQLFTFVTAPPTTQPNGKTATVGGTNNEAERTLRNPATARKTGRTSKTDTGTRRRTIVTAVLESLRLYIPVYTLRTVVDETLRWLAKGLSCFEERLQKLGLKLPEKPVLDQLYPPPQPSG
jgi:transposase